MRSSSNDVSTRQGFNFEQDFVENNLSFEHNFSNFDSFNFEQDFLGNNLNLDHDSYSVNNFDFEQDFVENELSSNRDFSTLHENAPGQKLYQSSNTVYSELLSD